jgi:hypothetical protein
MTAINRMPIPSVKIPGMMSRTGDDQGKPLKKLRAKEIACHPGTKGTQDRKFVAQVKTTSRKSFQHEHGCVDKSERHDVHVGGEPHGGTAVL